MCGEKPVFIMAVTSNRDDIEPSLRRPGRLDREIELGVPSSVERTQVIMMISPSFFVISFFFV